MQGANCWGDGLEKQAVSASMGAWKDVPWEFVPEHKRSVTMQHFSEQCERWDGEPVYAVCGL